MLLKMLIEIVHFLLLPQCFLLVPRRVSVFKSHLFCCLQKLSFWNSIKVCRLVNPLPNDKIWDVTKLKAFADDKLNVDNMMISLFDREENSVGKRENAGCQHF